MVHDGVAYPLLFSMLPKRGTSNTQERIDFVQRYINLFAADSIDSLLANREFVGEIWIKWLSDNRIRYFIRIRENFWAFNPKNGNPHIFDIKLIKTLFFFTIFQPLVTQYFALDIVFSM
ncbi:MAG: hypothetical protein MJZ46_03685 [Bacteroidales bacterium]|nr:hypothetical protein [Bacteroidales bacterium]